MKVMNKMQLWLLSLIVVMVMTACGSAPTTPVPPVPPLPAPTVAHVTTAFGAVTGLAGGKASTTITVTAWDIYGNLMAGQPVSVDVTGKSIIVGVVTQTATGVTITGVTNAQGVFTKKLTYVAAIGVIVTATAGGVAAPVVLAPNPTVSNISLNAVVVVGGVLADGIATQTVTIKAFNAGGNPIAIKLLTAAATSAQNGTTNLSAPNVTTGANGQTTITVSDVSAVDDQVSLSITDPDGAINSVITLFFTGSGTGSNTVINGKRLTIIQPTTVLANGVTAVTLTVNAFDTYTNTNAVNIPITLTEVLHGHAVFPASATTDAAGNAIFVIRDTYAETIRINARDLAGSVVAHEFVFTPYVVVANPQIVITPAGPYLADGVTAGHPLRITINDVNGAPQANQQITLSFDKTTATASAQSQTQAGGVSPVMYSSATGVIDLYVADSVAELVTLTATPISGIAKTSTIQFVAASANTITIKALPATAAPNGVSLITATATVKDANGVLVSNAQVDFYSSDPANIILSKTSVLTSNIAATLGQASVILTSLTAITTADIYATLPFNIGSKDVYTKVSFIEPVSVIKLLPNKTTAKANNTDAILLTARLLSATGQPLKNRTVSFIQQSFANVSAPLATNSKGETQVTITDKTAETITVTATSEGISSAPLTFTFSPVVKGISLIVTPAAASVPANGTSVATLTATVQGTGGVPIVGQVVSFDAYSNQQDLTVKSLATLSGISVITNATGQATITVSDSLAEDVYIRATADVYSSFLKIQFVPTNYFVFSTLNDPFLNAATANAAPNNLITFTVQDRNRNPAPNIPFAFDLYSAAGTISTTAQISPVRGTTGGNGVITLLVSDTSAEAITVSATNLITHTISTIPVQFVNRDAYGLTMLPMGLTVAIPPNGTAVTSLQALVKTSSALGNLAVANAWVKFAMTDPYAVLDAFKVLTDAQGFATVNIRSQRVTQATVTASLPRNSATSTATATATVNFETPVASINLSSDKASLAADGSTQAILTMVLLDAAGKFLPNQTITLSAIGNKGGTPVLSSKTVSSLANGIATVTLTDTYAGTVTVSATSNGIAAIPLLINFTPVVTTIIPSVIPTSNVPADGYAMATIIATVNDASGAPISGQTIDFYSATGSTTVQLSATSATTDILGKAFITVKDASPETVTIGIGTTPGVARASQAITFVASPLQYTVDQGTQPFFVGTDYPITVTVKDSAGTPSSGNILTISTPTSNTLVSTPLQLTTGAQGTATFTVNNSIAEFATLAFAADVYGFSLPLQFFSKDMYAMTLNASPASGLKADGVATATINVQVTDIYGAAIANVLVDFSTTSFDPYAVLSSSSGVTGANGIASVTLTRTQVGSVTIKGSLHSTGNAIISSGQATVSFGQTPAFVTLTPSLVRIPSDGVTASTVSVQVNDAVGGPIQGQTVTISNTLNATVSSPSFITDATGQGSFTVTDVQLETVTVTATANNISGTTSLTFIAAVNIIEPYSVVFTNALDANGKPLGGVTADVYTTPTSADTYSSYASGLDTVQVKFRVLDTLNAPLSGQAINLGGSGGQGGIPKISPTTSTSDANGFVTLTVTDAYAEVVTLTASGGGKTGSQAITFSPLPPATITSFLTIPAPAVVGIKGAGANESAALTFHVVDTNGQLVQGGHLVNFSIVNGVLGGGEKLTISQASTVNGAVTAIFNAGSKAGTLQVRASLATTPSIFADVTVTITGGLPAGNTFGLSILPLNIEGRKVSGITQVVSARVSDFFSNPVAPNIQAQFQTDFANITGSSVFISNGHSSSAQATITSAFPLPADGFVTAVGQTIGGQHSKILSLAIDPHSNGNIIYAGTDGGGIFKTIDGGQNWSHVGIPLRTVGTSKSNNLLGSIVRDLKIDPNNTTVLYAATEKGVFLSRNAGQDWETLTGFARVAGDQLQAVLDPYVGTATAGVFREDGFWSDSCSNINGCTATFFPLHFNNTGVRSRMKVSLSGVETTHYIVAGNGLYLTGTKRTSAAVSGKTLTVDYDRRSNIAAGAPIYAIAFDRYSYDPLLGYAKILYAGSYGDGVWKSTDGGKIWVKTSSMLKPATTFDLRVMKLVVDTYALGQGYVFAGTDGGGFYIADAAKTQWVRAVGTLTNPFGESVVQGITVQDPYIWVAGRNGIQYTTAYARNTPYNGTALQWLKATGINTGPQTSNTDARGFALSSNGVMYAITFGDVLGTGTTARGGVYRSLDQGATWNILTDVYTATGAHRLDSIDVYTSAPSVGGGVTSAYDTVIVGTEGRAFYKATFDLQGSTATWQAMNGAAPNNIINTLFTTQQVMHSGNTLIQVQPLTATYQPMDSYVALQNGLIGALAVSPASIYNGESVMYYIRVSDDFGNRLKGGTTIGISASAGLVTGMTNTTLADGVYQGTDYIVTWTNDIATAANVNADTVGSLNITVSSPNGGVSSSIGATLINPLVGISTPVVVSPYTTASSATILARGSSNGVYNDGMNRAYEFTSINGCVGTIVMIASTTLPPPAMEASALCNTPLTRTLYGTGATFVYNLPGTVKFTFTDTIIIRDLATNQQVPGTITITAQ